MGRFITTNQTIKVKDVSLNDHKYGFKGHSIVLDASALESLIHDQAPVVLDPYVEALEEAYRNFQQRVSIVIAEILGRDEIEDPSEEQINELWNALNADALFWEEWEEDRRNRANA